MPFDYQFMRFLGILAFRRQRVLLVATISILCLIFSGCSVGSLASPPWHFRGDSSDFHTPSFGAVPPEFVELANRDFARIMAAYERGSYNNDFEDRLPTGSYTPFHWTPLNDGISHGFSIRSYFDQTVRLAEIKEEYSGLVAEWEAMPPSQRPKGFVPPNPEGEWRLGYYESKFKDTDKERCLSCTLYPNGPDTGKRYGFIWKNDFSHSHREIDMGGTGIAFQFWWRQYTDVPLDVSMNRNLESNSCVSISYDAHKNITGMTLPEVWGAAVVQ